MIYIASPQHLAQFLRETREFYLRRGWGIEHCSIGFYENKVRMASDNGCIDYIFDSQGIIRRHSYGGYSKLVEFVDSDYAITISRHNRTILERAKNVS